MQKYPFTFSQSQAQAYKWIEERYPDLFQKIQKAVKEGRWEIVGGMIQISSLIIFSGGRPRMAPVFKQSEENPIVVKIFMLSVLLSLFFKISSGFWTPLFQ
ncbi:MAG: hypothetical protein U9R03_03855 [Candidatus Aerophobetes bacterium]|nr:hypothetical protein [Candidatus Aerophobetes bacterium]